MLHPDQKDHHCCSSAFSPGAARKAVSLQGLNGTMGDGLTCPMAKESHQAVLAARAIILSRNNPSNKQNQRNI